MSNSENEKTKNNLTSKKTPALDEPIPFFQNEKDSFDFLSVVKPIQQNQTVPTNHQENFFDQHFQNPPSHNQNQINSNANTNQMSLNQETNEYNFAQNDYLDNQTALNNNYVQGNVENMYQYDNANTTEQVFQDQSWDENPDYEQIYNNNSMYSQIAYDDQSGQYYDQMTGHFYDQDYQQFYNGETGEWYYYSPDGNPIVTSIEDGFIQTENQPPVERIPKTEMFQEQQSLEQNNLPMDFSGNTEYQEQEFVQDNTLPIKSTSDANDFYRNEFSGEEQILEPSGQLLKANTDINQILEQSEKHQNTLDKIIPSTKETPPIAKHLEAKTIAKNLESSPIDLGSSFENIDLNASQAVSPNPAFLQDSNSSQAEYSNDSWVNADIISTQNTFSSIESPELLFDSLAQETADKHDFKLQDGNVNKNLEKENSPPIEQIVPSNDESLNSVQENNVDYGVLDTGLENSIDTTNYETQPQVINDALELKSIQNENLQKKGNHADEPSLLPPVEEFASSQVLETQNDDGVFNDISLDDGDKLDLKNPIEDFETVSTPVVGEPGPVNLEKKISQVSLGGIFDERVENEDSQFEYLSGSDFVLDSAVEKTENKTESLQPNLSSETKNISHHPNQLHIYNPDSEQVGIENEFENLVTDENIQDIEDSSTKILENQTIDNQDIIPQSPPNNTDTVEGSVAETQYYQEMYNKEYQDQYQQQYGEYPEQYPEGYQEQYPEQYPEEYQEQYQEQYPEEYQEQYTEQYPEEYQGQYPEQYPEEYQEQYPEENIEEVTGLSQNPNKFVQKDFQAFEEIQDRDITNNQEYGYYGYETPAYESGYTYEQNTQSESTKYPPVICFGFGGKIVTVFPTRSTDSSIINTRVNIDKLSRVIPSAYCPAPDENQFIYDGKLEKNHLASMLQMSSERCSSFVKGADAVNAWKIQKTQSTRLENNLNQDEKDDSETLCLRVNFKKAMWTALQAIIQSRGFLENCDKAQICELSQTIESISGSSSNTKIPLKNRRQDGISDTLTQPETDMVQAHALSHGNPKQLQTVESLLLKGDRLGAVNFSVSNNMWTHALIISSCVSVDVWKSTVSNYIKEFMPNGSLDNFGDTEHFNDTEFSLNIQYKLFVGMKTEALEINKNTDTLTNNTNESWKVKWAKALAVTISNYTPGYLPAITSLGDKLMSIGEVESAHLCYVLSMSTANIFQRHSTGLIKYPMIGGSVRLGTSLKTSLPGINYDNLDAVSQTKFKIPSISWDSSKELGLMWTEMYEVAQVFNVAFSSNDSATAANLGGSSNSNPSKGVSKQDKINEQRALALLKKYSCIPHLQAYKLSYAWWLTDCGYNELALRYCDSINNIINLDSGANSLYFNEAFKRNLSGLQNMLIESGVNVTPDNTRSLLKTKTNSQTWLNLSVPKPSLSTIFNVFDSSIEKLISGSSPHSVSGNQNGTYPNSARNSMSVDDRSDGFKGKEAQTGNKWELGPDKYSIPADSSTAKQGAHFDLMSVSSARQSLDGYSEYPYNATSDSEMLYQANFSPKFSPQTSVANRFSVDGHRSEYIGTGSKYHETLEKPGTGNYEASRNINSMNGSGRGTPVTDMSNFRSHNISNVVSGRSVGSPYQQFAAKNMQTRPLDKRKAKKNNYYAISPFSQNDNSNVNGVGPENSGTTTPIIPRPDPMESMFINSSDTSTFAGSGDGYNQNGNMGEYNDMNSVSENQKTVEHKQDYGNNNNYPADDDDDFMGFGNKSLNKKKASNQDSENSTLAENDEKSQPNSKTDNLKKANTQEISKKQSKFGLGLFKGLFWSANSGASGDDSKGTRADLGEKNSFVYDPVEKRWVNKIISSNDTKSAEPAPGSVPPPKSSFPPPKSTSSPFSAPPSAPPSALPPNVSSGTLNGISNNMNESNFNMGSNLTSNQINGVNNNQTRQLHGSASFSSNPLLPSSESTTSLRKGSNTPLISENGVLTRPAQPTGSVPPRSARAGGPQKRGARNRYVDVFNQQQ
ncbi:hypothetical protein BB558_001773 [Smittium angustum]|uniref:COPII coat assembly protein SEC16 n=1 Tax=Smittium angustum TaxID=133377 RepID=A0A2U1JAQ5_SMIAN|nr:hypothetical protein BB558_001773 [Smittium angustum]